MAARALLILLLLTACSPVEVKGTKPPVKTPTPSPIAAEVGVSYWLEMPTDCGLRGTFVDGEIWVVDGTPTSGFAHPVDRGTFTLMDPGHAIYRSQLGVDFTLRRVEVMPSFEPCID